jgi:hypothetical protein
LSARKLEDLKKRGLKFLLSACAFSLTISLIGMIVTGAQQTTVRVVPESNTVPNVGLALTVNVTIENVEDLYGLELKLYYPNDVLNGTSVTEGPFLKAGGIATAFLVSDFIDSYNATYGLVNVLCLRTGNVSGVSGNGTLMTITFTSTSTNEMEILHLADVKLSDSNTTVIPSTTADGEVTVIPEFPAALVLPLLIASTIVAITLRKKMINGRGIFQSV